MDTVQAVYQQAADRNKSGLDARIDVNRSLVEFQSQEQRLTSLTTDFEKQKIALARLIGLPLAQTFTLTDTVPYREPPPPTVDDMVQRAFASRADVLAAAAQQKAAELSRAAAVAEYLPALELNGDYGLLGVIPTNQAHATYTASGGVRIPIFRFGRIRADIEQADAALAQRKAEYEDLKRYSGRTLKLLRYNNLLGFPYRYGYTPFALHRILTANGFSPVAAHSSSLLTPPYPKVSGRILGEWRAVRREGEASLIGDGPWIEIVSRRVSNAR